MDTDPATPTGEYSQDKARMIAAALTGDTAEIQRGLDEIANDQD